jgi:hypothetical protein
MPRRYASKQPSEKQRLAHVAQLVACCTRERFAEMTAEGLAKSWNVPVAKVATMIEARKARAA